MTTPQDTAVSAVPWRGASALASIRAHPSVILGGALLLLVAMPSALAPLAFTVDPVLLEPAIRLRPPSGEEWFGTDMFGRDIYSRAVYGGRTSLIVGFSVSATAVLLGLVIGAVAGYIRIVDAIVMRIMDGLMAIPGLLLAIALVSVSGASLPTVIVAIAIPEIPRVVRLVRGVVLSIREEPYVEAAVAVGTQLAPDPLASRSAQHRRSIDRPRHLYLRLCDHGGSRIEFSRRRHSP